jgi:hypothetical protein
VKTRQKDRDNPPPESPWNEIRPGLWMGGHVRAGEEPVVAGREFDLVLSLYQREGHGPPIGVEHHFAEMPDGPLSEAQIAELGLTVPKAIALVRLRRSPWALHNELFVQYLESGLPTARLLVGLGS